MTAPALPWRRWLLLFALPSTAILVLYLAPLMLGSETLFLRDVFSAHLPLKAAQHLPTPALPSEVASPDDSANAPLWPPAVAPRIAGGQPLRGNLNAVPYYPDNLLYRVAPFLWSLNAHFWIHWLLAPWAMLWLGRVFGLSRPAAWAAATAYAASGFMVSQMNLYNLVAGTALAPALIAALVVATAALDDPLRGRLRQPWDLLVLALLWCLILLSGDPMIAALALALALLAALLCHGPPDTMLRAPQRWLPAASAGIAGTLLAAPQLLELRRILPLSARAYGGMATDEILRASFKPLMTLDWVLPFAFGRPDKLRDAGFWAFPLYDDIPPLFFTLYPGLLAFALAMVGLWSWMGLRKSDPRAGRLGLFAGAALSGGLFFALGSANPAVRWLVETVGAGGLRFPVKLWLAVALGSALLAGLGAEAFLRRGPRRLLTLLTAFAVVFAAGGAYLTFAPESATAALRALIPPPWPDAFVDAERARWAALCGLSFGLLTLFIVLIAGFRRRPQPALAVALALHWATQLILLSPALPTDSVAAYTANAVEASPLAAALPSSARIVHGAHDRLFGRQDPQQEYNGIDTLAEYNRRRVLEMAPTAGVLAGRRYDLNLSPEGLSSFLTKAARDALRQGSDAQRTRLLAAWGVDRLVLHRPLAADAQQLARPLASTAGPTRTATVYAIDAAPPVSFASRITVAPSLSHALNRLAAADFDPKSEIVLAGAEARREGMAAANATTTAATIKILALDSQRLVAEVSTEAPGALLWQRAHLPLYSATIDGRPAVIEIANLHRMAVRLSAGTHRVEIRVETCASTGIALVALGAILLFALTFLGMRSQRRRAFANADAMIGRSTTNPNDLQENG